MHILKNIRNGENDMQKIYVCRKIRLLNHLLNKGFMFIRTEKDKYRSNYNVWLFIDTLELRNSIEEYYSSIPKKGERSEARNSLDFVKNQ